MRNLKATPYFILLFCTFCFLKPFSGNGQVPGCKDPAANNYNSAATVNNGSCTYNASSYTPPVKVDPINTILKESSGLQWAGNYLWSFNDGGGAAAIYRIDTASSAVLQTVKLGTAKNVDWEDIAFDGTYFYIGDFGNNANGARTDLKIYKFPFSAISSSYTTHSSVTIPDSLIKIIRFTYKDQPQPPVASSNNYTKYDCEAMIVANGKIHLFSKNWVNLTSTHYVISSTAAGTYVASPLETLATNYLVTGADKSVGNEVVALIGYQNSGAGNHYLHILSDYSGGYYFNGNKRRIDLPNATVMGQAEGITFRNGTYGYISNEFFQRTVSYFTITVNQKLRSFNIKKYIPSYIATTALKSLTVTNVTGTHKIAWDFSAPVQNLKLQSSTDGRSFNDVNVYGISSKSNYYNKNSTASNFYRLTWKKEDGSDEYSSIVSAKNTSETDLSNISVSANGQLDFILKGDPAIYAFELISPDGNVLARLKEQPYLPGSYSLRFLNRLPAGKNAFLIIYNAAERKDVQVLIKK